MRFARGLHLAYCAALPGRGTWTETFAALRAGTDAVRARVCALNETLGLGLRLGDAAFNELSKHRCLAEFRRWLTEARCYVFTVDALPETARGSDWQRPERLAHLCRLLELLGVLLPEGVDGSVSVRPGPGRECAESELQAIYANLIHLAVHAAEISGQTGRRVQLALEPEMFGLFENTAETVRFLEPLVGAFPDQFGVCFDAGHFAFRFEEAVGVLAELEQAGVSVAKLRLGTAVRVRDGEAARQRLKAMGNGRPCPVAVRRGRGIPTFYRDLDAALSTPIGEGNEWRLQMALEEPGDGMLDTTANELPGVLDWLAVDPDRCSHLEGGVPFERSTEQAAREYQWAVGLLRECGLA